MVGDGQTAVFSLPPDASRERESVVAVVGTKAPDNEHHRVRAEVGAAVRGAFGFCIDDIVLVPSGSLPRTTSGKLQRFKVRELYLQRRLRMVTN
ncbi:hypothetical protein [Mycobacterium simulans]